MCSTFLFAGIVVLIACVYETATTTCSLHPRGDSYFPSNFSFGVATSAYQVEGGWNADGKGPSIWDDFTQNNPHLIHNHSNGNIAADSYNRFDQDLAAMKELKVNHYRFSISWPRIFPNGDISSLNQKGIDYYNMVIDKLLANGIQPMVTMFHYDLPLEIQKIGGFANTLLIEKFVMYAAVLFENFGDRVKLWITFNEPLVYCVSSYGVGRYPPLVDLHGVGDYICVTNTLKAHAAAYKMYKSRYFEKQRGKIGLALDSNFYLPYNANDTDDIDATYRGLQFNMGFLAHAVYHRSGGYPDIMVKDIEANSRRENRLTSRLPSLDGYWKNMIQGSADYFALNYYTARLIRRALKPLGLNPSWQRDMDCDEILDPSWLQADEPWLNCVPEGLEGMLKFIRDEYDNVEVIISENGWCDDGKLEDDDRILYLKSHLQAVLNALSDGSNISGYTYWSLIDNFEWKSGYSIKFGLYAVDMASPKRKRTAKKSAHFYKQVIKMKALPSEFDMNILQ